MRAKILSLFLQSIPANSLICEPDSFGRILNYDQSGRSFESPDPAAHWELDGVSVLSELHVGECGVVVALDLPDSVQNHLMHMGFVPSATVRALRRAPAGDPTVYSVDGLEIALRRETAAAIQIRATEIRATQIRASEIRASEIRTTEQDPSPTPPFDGVRELSSVAR